MGKLGKEVLYVTSLYLYWMLLRVHGLNCETKSSCCHDITLHGGRQGARYGHDVEALEY